MSPNTTACIHSSGKTIAGKDCQSKKLISRINSVNQLLCDVERRINNERFKLSRYCEIETSSESTSSSSSSSQCFKPCSTVPEFMYLVTTNDLDGDVNELVDLLEQEACALLRKLVNFEKSNQPCVSPSSSSSFSSSSSSSHYPPPPSSSSSSSLPPPSSSSSSSSLPSCPPSLYIASYCPTLPHISVSLVSWSGAPIADKGDCVYYGTIPYVPIPPSSSSSSNSASSSSSSIPPLGISLIFDEATNSWNLTSDMHGLIATRIGYEYDPRGTYTYVYGPCAGQSIFVV